MMGGETRREKEGEGKVRKPKTREGNGKGLILR
jgi:hypothetical protein